MEFSYYLLFILFELFYFCSMALFCHVSIFSESYSIILLPSLSLARIFYATPKKGT